MFTVLYHFYAVSWNVKNEEELSYSLNVSSSIFERNGNQPLLDRIVICKESILALLLVHGYKEL